MISTGIRTTDNAVLVGIKDLSTTKSNAIEKRFGPGLLFREDQAAHADACNSVHDCRPIKGGLEIYASDNTSRECTAGFVTRNEYGNLGVLTAGHCIQVHGGYDIKWYHNHDAFGWSRYETWDVGVSRTADVGLTTLSTNETPAHANDIYVGALNIRRIVGWSSMFRTLRAAPCLGTGTTADTTRGQSSFGTSRNRVRSTAWAP